MRNNKEIIIKVLPKLVITISFIIIIAVFKLNFLQASAGILLYTLIVNGIGGALSVAGLLAGIYIITELSGLSAVKAFILVGLLIAFFILYTRRAALIDAIRYVEKKHFGETMEERKQRFKE